MDKKPIHGFETFVVICSIALLMPTALAAMFLAVAIARLARGEVFIEPAVAGVIALGVTAMGAVWVRDFAREKARELESRCLNCGYDLRGSRGRCPECGAASTL